MSEQVAAHPIWASGDEQIKAEYQRALDERDEYLSWFQRADSEAERLQFALEELVQRGQKVARSQYSAGDPMDPFLAALSRARAVLNQETDSA